MKILALIPARSGSKGIPDKNIKKFNGKPLIYWSIKHAKESKYIDKIIVSTDSVKYADIAKNYGAEVPFLRPVSISQDLSTDYEFVEHCLNWLKNNDKYYPDIIVQLRPTYPNRNVELIDDIIKIFLNNYTNYDSLRTVVPFEKSAFKMYKINDNVLYPLFNKIDNILEPYNQCRQILPKCYLHNGYLDIFKSNIIFTKKSISGDKIYPYIMDMNKINDIDTLNDWSNALASL